MGINATVGSFQPFEVFDFVKEIEGGLSTKDKYAYSSVDGGEKFRQATNSYLGLSDHYVISTPGGTGAITTSVGLTLEKGETLLIPYPCWGPYFGDYQSFVDSMENTYVQTFTTIYSVG